MDSLAVAIGFAGFAERDVLDLLLKKQHEYMEKSKAFIESYFSEHETTPESVMTSYICRLKTLIFWGGYGHHVSFRICFPEIPDGQWISRDHAVVSRDDYVKAQPTAFEKLAIDFCALKHKDTYCSISETDALEKW